MLKAKMASGMRVTRKEDRQCATDSKVIASGYHSH